MVIERVLDLRKLLKNKSFFLFGPRATGKSFLICAQFSHDTPYFDLLEHELYLRLSESPDALEAMIAAYDQANVVIIDEVQRIPALLNVACIV